MAAIVIHRVQHAHRQRQAQGFSQTRQSKVKANAGLALCKAAFSGIGEAEAEAAILRNQGAPIKKGILKKWAFVWYNFSGVWHDRYFVLDPAEGTFSYWEPGMEAGPPKYQYLLRDLTAIESQQHWQNIWITFGKSNDRTKEKKGLNLKAANESEFLSWMNALSPYMKEVPTYLK